MAGPTKLGAGCIAGLARIDMTPHALAVIGFLPIHVGLVVMAGRAADIWVACLERIFVKYIDALLEVVMAVQALIESHVQVMGKDHCCSLGFHGVTGVQEYFFVLSQSEGR